MPRYFFNVHDDKRLPDDTGEVFTDWREAKQYAVKYAGTILATEGDRLNLDEDWRMEVCDNYGLILFRLEFYVSLAPILSEKRQPSESLK